MLTEETRRHILALTAETLTAEQIHEVHRTAGCCARTAAHALGIGYPTHADAKPTAEEQRAAREFIAETLMSRAEITARLDNIVAENDALLRAHMSPESYAALDARERRQVGLAIAINARAAKSEVE